MRCPLFRVACLLLLLLSAGPAHAWAELGHRLVGELAQQALTPAAQREVNALLEGEAEPTLGGVAYWADTLRSSDPDRFRATSRWHYVSLVPDCRFDANQACPDGNCVVGAIREQARKLADRSLPIEVRRDALKFVVHFAGDVHQPLHASNRDDRGGNTFQISLRTTIPPEDYARAHYKDGIMGTNLHAVWDHYVLASADRSAEDYARHLLSQPLPETEPNPDPAHWAEESCRMIDSFELYPSGHIMDHSYLEAMRPLAERRVQIAAQRLAQLLNGALSQALQ